MLPIEPFLRDIDAQWRLPQRTKIRLHIIGAAALRLQTASTRGTKDSDVLETDQLTSPVRSALLRLAGDGSLLHRKYRLHIEIVPRGIPFLPPAPIWHDLPTLNESLDNFSIHVLDVADVVVSKLKRFGPNDRADIDEMIEAGLVSHAALLTRFRAAFDRYLYDARAEDLPKYVASLHAVEQDSLGARPTPFEIPEFADR